jgi:hypothetical protein
MSQVFKRDSRDGYVYDPIIKGYDTTFWKSITGTPAMSSTVLRFTSAVAGSYIQHVFADVEFLLNVPVKPTAGDVRQWGFKNPSSINLGAVYFDITGTAFTLKVYDNFGNLTSTTLTWIDGTYSAAAIKFRLRWEPDQVIAYINGVKVATVDSAGGIPPNALGLYINNGNADNMDLSYIGVRNAAAIV